MELFVCIVITLKSYQVFDEYTDNGYDIFSSTLAIICFVVSVLILLFMVGCLYIIGQRINAGEEIEEGYEFMLDNI